MIKNYIFVFKNSKKKFSVLLASLSAVSEAVITADTDGKCQLLTATCDENGFQIIFDSTCQAQDFMAVQWNELYASGPTVNTGLATFGSTATANSECLFNDSDGDGVYQMNFNFPQCGTVHDDTGDTSNLIYHNTVQAQEYYNDIILGVKVQFDLTCTADRTATITSATEDIDGDKDFISADAQNRPVDWAQNVLSLSFYESAAYATAMTDNIIQFGEKVFARVDTNVVSEDIYTRVTDCWATETSGQLFNFFLIFLEKYLKFF